MSIGRALDRAIDATIVAAGTLANWLLNRIPFDEQAAHRYLTMGGAEQLAEREAEREQWEPDELWPGPADPNRFDQHNQFDQAYRDLMARNDGMGALPKLSHDDFAEPLGEYPEMPPTK